MATYPDKDRPAIGADERELFWLAFCYTAGELSAAQAVEFEARLETDQRAREAVAEAVELAAAARIASAPSLQPAAVQPGIAPAGGWALALAASIALAIVGYSLLGRHGLPAASPDSNQAERGLVDAWAASAWIDESDAEIGDDSNRLAGWEPTAANPDESDLAEGELLVSDWLLEAVSAGQDVPAVESGHREG